MEDTLLILGQVGSKAYNTDTEESDDDWMGVCLAPISHYIGLDEWGDRKDSGVKIDFRPDEGIDHTIYELKKFVKLCTVFNPNVMTLLYLDEYEILHPAGKLLIQNRDAFNSIHAYHRFAKYAENQLAHVMRSSTGEVSGKLGQKRKNYIEKFGYDVKFACHTIRLLRMVHEFMDTKVLKVYRDKDAEELRSIRRGEWPLQKFLDESKSLMADVKVAAEHCDLPPECDYQRVNNVVMEIISKFIK